MNLKKWIISSVCISICFISCQSQTNNASTKPNQGKSTDCNLTKTQGSKSTNSDQEIFSDYNLKDAQGRKYGLWIEHDDSVVAYIYYKEDLRDGVCIVYSSKTGNLTAFGEFEKGKKSAKWYYFNESTNHLLFTQENIKKNTEYTRMIDDVVITPEFTAYLKFYYPNGEIKEEGLVLFDEDAEIDNYKYGTWKYYDKEGNLTETKEEHE